jgi:hypothetical protein
MGEAEGWEAILEETDYVCIKSVDDHSVPAKRKPLPCDSCCSLQRRAGCWEIKGMGYVW